VPLSYLGRNTKTDGFLGTHSDQVFSSEEVAFFRLRRVSASLDSWNGHPIRNADTAITLTSVLAQEGPDDVYRKIPNRKLFAAQFTMASDASDTTVAAYGLNGRLSNFVFTQALLPHEVGFSSALREMSAIHKTLLCRGNVLRMESQTTLWWLTDNSAVASIFL
jgi:hypothetical protein